MAIEAISDFPKFTDFSLKADVSNYVANLTTNISTLESNVKSSLAKQWVKSSDSYGGGSVLSNLSQLTNGPKFQSISYLPSNPVETLPWFYVVSNTSDGTMSETGYTVSRNSAEVFNRAYNGEKYLPAYDDYKATIKLLPGFYLVDYKIYRRGGYTGYQWSRTGSSINYYSGVFWVVHAINGNLERNWIADSIYIGANGVAETTTIGYGMIKVGTEDSTTPISCTFNLKIFGTSGYSFVPCLALSAKFTKVANISS